MITTHAQKWDYLDLNIFVSRFICSKSVILFYTYFITHVGNNWHWFLTRWQTQSTPSRKSRTTASQNTGSGSRKVRGLTRGSTTPEMPDSNFSWPWLSPLFNGKGPQPLLLKEFWWGLSELGHLKHLPWYLTLGKRYKNGGCYGY